MKQLKILSVSFAMLVGYAGGLHAQTTVALPDENQTTTLTANVTEQARVQVPAGVTFNVANVAVDTAASAASVTIDNIVLASATKKVKISIQADDASFEAPENGATTWSAADVSWNAATWTNATGQGDTPLNHSFYQEVATCAADTASCSTTDLVFTLKANGAVKRSGNHTLTVKWKIESING